MRLLKSTLPVDKVKVYNTYQHKGDKHKTYFVEMVFNEKLAKVTDKMLVEVGEILGAKNFTSVKKVNKRIKLVLHN